MKLYERGIWVAYKLYYVNTVILNVIRQRDKLDD